MDVFQMNDIVIIVTLSVFLNSLLGIMAASTSTTKEITESTPASFTTFQTTSIPLLTYQTSAEIETTTTVDEQTSSGTSTMLTISTSTTNRVETTISNGETSPTEKATTASETTSYEETYPTEKATTTLETKGTTQATTEILSATPTYSTPSKTESSSANTTATVTNKSNFAIDQSTDCPVTVLYIIIAVEGVAVVILIVAITVILLWHRRISHRNWNKTNTAMPMMCSVCREIRPCTGSEYVSLDSTTRAISSFTPYDSLEIVGR